MSTITETATYEATINQTEPGEIIKAGSGNRANQAIQNLANRTAYLKQHVDTNTTNIGNNHTDITTINTALIGLQKHTSVRSANFTVTNHNETIFADTSGSAWTLTLPAAPVIGDIVKVIDVAGNWGTHNLTINRNGHDINNLAENLVCDVDNCSVTLEYSNATYGWIIS